MFEDLKTIEIIIALSENHTLSIVANKFSEGKALRLYTLPGIRLLTGNVERIRGKE